MSTAKKYHISPTTGRPNQCTATVRGCKYAVDGKMPEHYGSKEEAQASSEKTFSKEYGSTSTLKKDPSKINLTSSVERKLLLGLEEKSGTKPAFEVPHKQPMANSYTQNAWVGSRRAAYDEKKNGYLGAKQVATNIRQDVKDAVKAGYLPANLKYSIVTDKYAGGFAIRARVSGMGDVYDTHEYNERRGGLELKSEYKETLNKLQEIHDGWNYNDSDGSIDYFNNGFYGDIRESSPSEEAYIEYDRSRKAFNKILAEKKGNRTDLARDTEALAVEKDYFEKLQKATELRELENELFDSARAYGRKPNEQEYSKIKELAEARATLSVINSKKKYGILENTGKLS